MHRWQVINSLVPNATAGAEVGTLYGENALGLLRSNPKLFLYLVDPYREYLEPGMSAGKLEIAEQIMRANLKPYRRWAHIRLSSARAAVLFDEPLDFVFIDAQHTESAVRRDIKAWEPRAKVLLGHDYSWPGVRAALQGRNVKLFDEDIWQLCS